jgi:hypothetical protein
MKKTHFKMIKIQPQVSNSCGGKRKGSCGHITKLPYAKAA